jgi:hypothetical protein
VLLTGLQPNVKEDGQIPVPHDQTALPQPSTQEIVRCKFNITHTSLLFSCAD